MVIGEPSAQARLSACLYAEFCEGGGAAVVYLCFIGERFKRHRLMGRDVFLAAEMST